MIHKMFKIPIYFGEIHVFINNDFKEVSDKYKLELEQKYFEGHHSAVVGHFPVQDQAYQNILYFWTRIGHLK